MVVQTSPVQAPAIPLPAAKPRKPNEWTFIIRGPRKLAQVGVYPENRIEDLKWWISEESTKAEKKSRGSGGGDSKSTGQDTDAAQSTQGSAPQEPKPLYLHVKEGENEEVYPLSAEDAAKYGVFSSELKAKRGIYIIRAVRGSKTVALPNKSKYWLSPRRTTEAIMPGEPKAGQNIAAYNLFQRKLETGNYVLVCHHYHGKGFTPVLIMASEEGLVMVQVPLITQFHTVGDAIDPAWKAVRTDEALREKFDMFFDTLVSENLEPSDFEHPERLLLQKLLIQKREAGEAKVDSEMFLEGGFDDALTAMIEEAGAPLVVETPKKAPKKSSAKKGTDGAAAKPRAPRSANPKKPR